MINRFPARKFPFSLLLASLPLLAQAGHATLAETPIEKLMDISVEVSSASRKPQRLEDTAAAIHVITRDEIRRSGMSSVPELLRMVPGLQVARIDGSTWAISSRGFNAKNSDNLLVMIDGRTLQTPTFTGVNWDALDVVLEDIERIEVIRGPGGALWGSNAVTGIIHILTRTAADTQGGLLQAGAGSHERQQVLRYGAPLGDSGHIRLYARGIDQDRFPLASGQTANDQRKLHSTGFRADWNRAGGNGFTLQGDYYTGVSNHTGSQVSLAPPTVAPLNYGIDLSGGNLLGRWKRTLSPSSEWTAQFYVDRYARRYFNLGEWRETIDLDVQHRFLHGERHDIVWGFGYRRTRDRMDNTEVVAFTPASRSGRIFSLFVQDEIAVLRDRLHLIAGIKLENNDYTGLEPQPNLRLRWSIDDRQTAWAALSRATHTPSRTDADGLVLSSVTGAASALPNVLVLRGNPAIDSERVQAWEAGYRFRPNDRLSADVALFRNEHRNMMTLEPQTPFIVFAPFPYRAVPLSFFNRANATTSGLEIGVKCRPDEHWQIGGSWSLLRIDIALDADSRDASLKSEEGRSPRQQFQLHAAYAPHDGVNFSGALYRVASLPSLNVPAYTRLDLHARWRIRPDFELAIALRNLLDSSHPEFINPSGPRVSEAPRSAFLMATWRF